MPALFACGFLLVGNVAVATFVAFGSFAMLLLADVSGPLADRLAAQAGLIATGAVLICLATLASRNVWAATISMLVVGFLVLFAGVVSSVLAGASTAILLSFILPVTTPGAAAAIPDRVAGWLLAGAVALPAMALLWPAPSNERLRDAVADACRRLAARLTAECSQPHGGDGATVAEARARSDAAVEALRARFLATPYRPSGLSAATRAVVHLVDEVLWLDVILDDAAASPRGGAPLPAVREVKAAAGVLLDHAGKALGRRDPPQDSLQDHLDGLTRARRAMGTAVVGTVRLPLGDDADGELAASLRPGFRAHELGVAVTAIATDVEKVTAADRRSWWQKLLGRQAGGHARLFASAQQRALAHAEPHSVWLHNSIRGAIALAGAVLVADLSGVQHSFWIVLGALSVLRSNALSTGQNVVRGLFGTIVGFAIGGGLVLVLGTHVPLLWLLLPVAVLVAGIAPAFSFAAGQAGFTFTLLVLFNILSPAGWRVGLVRIEDVAIGCAVSLVVGAMFWPRGAAAALARALSEAYAECAASLRAAADTGEGTDGSRTVPDRTAARASAAAGRLDDAFREFLAERGRKHLSLSEVATLLTGCGALRLTADAVRDLWLGEPPAVETPQAQRELRAAGERVTNWYLALAQAVVGVGAVPRALPRDGGADGRLVDGLRRDLDGRSATDARVRAHAVRLLWTADHLDAARRLQDALEPPARAVAYYQRPSGPPLPWRARSFPPPELIGSDGPPA